MGVFWAFVIGVPLVVLGVLAWAAMTVEVTPAHSRRPPTRVERGRRAFKSMLRRKPLSNRQQARQQARKEARRAGWAARLTRARGLLRRPERSREPAIAPASLVTGAPPEKADKDVPPAPAATDPGGFPVQEEPGEDWATDLRAKLAQDEEDDPNKHLQRYWERTGTWERGMLDKMLADGQMPPAEEKPPPLNHTEEWLARTEQTGEPDAFMGREPAEGPEEDGGSA